MSNTIQPQDLRIGNILSFHSKNEKVIELSEDWIMLSISNKVPLTAIGLSAIPLTEEIMVKCGFTASDFTFDLQKISICLPGVAGYKKGRTYFNSWCIIEGIPDSVHQLQNLFHSLTGLELEIKL